MKYLKSVDEPSLYFLFDVKRQGVVKPPKFSFK